MHATADVLVALLESDLSASGWDSSTNSDLGRTTSQYAMTSIRNSLVKKFHNGIMTAELERLTLQGFLTCNAACETFVAPSQRDDVWPWDVELYNDVREILHQFCYAPLLDLEGELLFEGTHFPILDLQTIFQNAEHGPGASIGAKESSYYSKMAEAPLTATSDLLLGLYQEAIRTYPIWRTSEAKRCNKYGTRIVGGSRLSFVPKSTKIARTICTEPILNMFFQLGIGNILRKRMKVFFGLDLSSQPELNAHLAHFGSAIGGFATIDLKSASDTISLSLVRDLFPPEFVRWLELTRSPETTLPSGEVVRLSMISSMGNGFTFPLQTIIFAAILKAVYAQLGLTTSPANTRGRFSPGNFGVFGDDIVVDTRAYSRMNYALSLFGFTVNLDKSFGNGDFRESCGHDYYRGSNVRGVYISSLLSELDYLSAFNRLVRWSLEWVPLTNTLSFLRKGFRYLPVPLDESDIAGVKVPSPMAPVYEHGDLRKGQRRARAVGLWVYRYNKVVPLSRSLKRESEHEDTSDSVLITLLAGRIRNGRVGLRSNTVKTVTKTRVTPRWDYNGSVLLTEDQGRRWQALLLQVLSPGLEA